MFSPKVTIIIPCYNRVNLVKKAIFSVLDQTYKNLEIIAVDNESTDETPDFLNSIKESTLRNYTFLKAANIYPNCHDECIYEALKVFSGDYFTVIGSDDILSKKYIENNIKFLEANQEKNMLCWQSPMNSIDEHDVLIDKEMAHDYSDLNEFKSLCVNIGSPVNTPTVFYSKQVVDNGFFKTEPEVFGGAADYDLYCSLADKGVFIYPSNENFGYYYRWHNVQATWSVHKEGKDYAGLIKQKWNNVWQLK